MSVSLTDRKLVLQGGRRRVVIIKNIISKYSEITGRLKSELERLKTYDRTVL
jgi:hypothetical protein